MKLYDFKRDLVHHISAMFPDLVFSHLGTLFAEAWLTDEQADEVLKRYPNSIKLIYRS
jgi:hypothetical protein